MYTKGVPLFACTQRENCIDHHHYSYFAIKFQRRFINLCEEQQVHQAILTQGLRILHILKLHSVAKDALQLHECLLICLPMALSPPDLPTEINQNNWLWPKKHFNWAMKHTISVWSLTNPHRGCSHFPHNILFILKVKILMLIKWSYRSPPPNYVDYWA